MKITFGIRGGAVLAAALVVAACSGSPAIPSIPIPGAGNPGGNPGNQCAAYPTFNAAASAQPSIPVDTALLESFPKQVGSEPVTNVAAVPFLPFLCTLGGQATVDRMLGTTSILGFDISTMSFGNFSVIVNTTTIKVTALRTPGKDAGAMISNFALFGAFAGVTGNGGALASTSLGNKNVQVATDSSTGDKTYFYVHGDTLFIIDTGTDAEVGPVLQALP